MMLTSDDCDELIRNDTDRITALLIDVLYILSQNFKHMVILYLVRGHISTIGHIKQVRAIQQ